MTADTIASIRRSLRGCYGVRRTCAELTLGLGISVRHDQIARVMSRWACATLAGTRKRYMKRKHLITGEDLVDRNFTVNSPYQLWRTDVLSRRRYNTSAHHLVLVATSDHPKH